MNKRLFSMILMLSALFIFAGCVRNEDVIESIFSSDTGYKAYSIGAGASELRTSEYRFKAQTVEELIEECKNLLIYGTEEDSYGALPPGFTLESCVYNEEFKTVSVFLEGDYNGLTPSQRVLMKAAIVDTFTQFDSIISYVRLYNYNELLADPGSGVSRALMKSDFVESTMADIKNINQDTFTIYFASTDNTMLVADTYDIHYNKTVSKSRVVMDALISGPLTASLNRVLPTDTRINGIEVKDGLCTVDFDSSFLTPYGEQSFSIKVFAIVNSLCELDEVDQVQILVNGKTADTSELGIVLSDPFTVNTDLILKPSDNPPVVDSGEETESSAETSSEEEME